MAGTPAFDAELIDSIVAVERRIAAAEAERAALMAQYVARSEAQTVSEVGSREAGVLAGQFAVDEIAAAVCWSRGRVEAEVARVRLLQSSLPRVLARWRAGEIDAYRVSTVTDAAHRLVDPASLAALDEAAAEKAPVTTATQLGGWCHRFVARTEPDQAERRHTRAVADRKVATRIEADGMGSAWALVNAVDLAAIDARLTRRARALGAGDPRSMDQRRADVFVNSLLGRDHANADNGGGFAAVVVTVPVQSLLGLCDDPGELVDRSASVPASLARQIAARPGTLFYRALTDPQGHLLDVTQLGRFPSQLLGFAVDIRDGTCRWPTCTARASGCDANHSPPWPQRRTRAADLADTCRRHHNGTTHAAITVRQPQPGTVEWTTPTGHVYTTNAEPLPVTTWWPTVPAVCPCDACDQPRLSQSDVADALPPHVDIDIDDLTTDDLDRLADAA